MAKKKEITAQMREEADSQISTLRRQIAYDTKDYTVELVVSKFVNGDFFIPNYQRGYVWKDKDKASFIESVLLGLPIPFMFFADCEDGKLEIIDGAQRVQTLVAFANGEITLTGLPKLNKLNGFKFCDLSDVVRRRFLNRSLRIVVLEESTPSDVRQDIFNRINTTGIRATPSEIRRGAYPGRLTDFIDSCSENELFVKLCPATESQITRRDRFELILRFFAYANDYLNFEHDVTAFLDKFLIENQDSFDEMVYRAEFDAVLKFVNTYFPCGFAKSKKATTTPKVRFEAIAVGVALALREEPDLVVSDVDWLSSEEFKQLTTSDASNNQGKLRKRIEYVRDQLLRGVKSNE